MSHRQAHLRPDRAGQLYIGLFIPAVAPIGGHA